MQTSTAWVRSQILEAAHTLVARLALKNSRSAAAQDTSFDLLLLLCEHSFGFPLRVIKTLVNVWLRLLEMRGWFEQARIFEHHRLSRSHRTLFWFPDKELLLN